jgi:hypothetical protein
VILLFLALAQVASGDWWAICTLIILALLILGGLFL